jgi:hypothetical protein
VYRGLSKIEKFIKPGVSVKDINELFLTQLNPTEDIVYGNVVNHTGFKGIEDDIPLDKFEEYDYVRLGVAISDANGGDVALVQHKAIPVVWNDSEKLSKFKGTYVEFSSKDLAKQLTEHESELDRLIAEQFGQVGETQKNTVYRGLLDTASKGKTFESAISDIFWSKKQPNMQEEASSSKQLHAEMSNNEILKLLNE